MENKFIINNDERQRILSLHEERTKNQYLNLISEQQTQTYDLKADVTLTNSVGTNNNLFLYKGTQFYKSTTKPGELQTSKVSLNRPQMMTGSRSQAENFKGNVFYGCKTGKFYTVSGQYHDKDTYYNQDLQKKLSPLCQSNSQSNQQTDKKTYSTAKPHTFGGGKVTLPVGTKFIQAKNGASAKVNGVWGFYSCKNQSYFVKGSNVGFKEDDKTQSLGKKLNQEFCKGSSIDTGFKQQKVGGSSMGNTDAIVIPTDIDLSQITKSLPADLQTVLTPPTVDGQPNTGGQPDFNQLLTQLQGLS